MLRTALVAALAIAAPAQAVVVVGTTALGTLINDAVSDHGLGGGSGTGTVGGGGFFPATTDRTAAGRQVWHYTFALAARSNLRVETGWIERHEYNCLPGTFPCGSDENSQIDRTFTSGIDMVTIDLTPAGGATRHYDPLTRFSSGSSEYFVNGEGFYEYDYMRDALLPLPAGSYTLDFTGYGAPGGPAFPGSGGGTQGVDVEALAVPEPATWTLLLGGFALTGAALRRRSAISRA